jgi:hypothetical protein
MLSLILIAALVLLVEVSRAMASPSVQGAPCALGRAC